MRGAGIFALATLVSACSIYPVAPKLSLQELRDRAPSDAQIPPDLSNSRALLAGLHKVLEDGADNRQTISIAASEVLYYGTLLAILGVTLDSRAARNTGAGLGFGAEIFTGHYKLADQHVIFQKALAQVICAEDAIAPVAPGVLNSFPNGNLVQVPPPNPPLADGMSAEQTIEALPARTIVFVRTVQKQLGDALDKVVLPAMSKEDLKTLVDTWDNSRKAAAAAQTGEHADPAKRKQLADLKAGRAQPQSDPQYANLSAAQQIAKYENEVVLQGAFLTALYAYGPALNLCLQQNKQ